ncbi:hypothetical protein R1flu_003133 [Riccia fluitans]|uniref:Uncharacterized protein n=1 Tax=Riccia fluitans TaxID=41844 RepID=A0ABD1Y847_9MARC
MVQSFDNVSFCDWRAQPLFPFSFGFLAGRRANELLYESPLLQMNLVWNPLENICFRFPPAYLWRIARLVH